MNNSDVLHKDYNCVDTFFSSDFGDFVHEIYFQIFFNMEDFLTFSIQVKLPKYCENRTKTKEIVSTVQIEIRVKHIINRICHES